MWSFNVDDFVESIFRPQDAFVHAASLDQIEVVRRWISKGHDINQPDKEGHLALCAAAQNRCSEVMTLLLESGVRVDEQQGDGKTALHVACAWGRFDAVSLLLRHGAVVSVCDGSGQMPLHGACKNGHDRVVQLLLDTQPDPFVADEFGATPLDLARDWQRLDIVSILDIYHKTVFTQRMRHHVRIALSSDESEPPPLPSSMEALVCSFLC